MKTRTAGALALVLVLVVIGALRLAHRPSVPPAVATAPSHEPAPAPRPAPPRAETPAPVRDPLPGQGRARVAPGDAAGGVIDGRVINGSTGEGVAGADLTFTSDAGASTIRSRDDGSFELAPPAPGRFTLTAIAATGFLPYAPELQHSTVHVALARGQVVRGITLFLYPAIDYHGRVVDAHGAPVAGARVRLLGTPAGEQVLEHPTPSGPPTQAADSRSTPPTTRSSRRRAAPPAAGRASTATHRSPGSSRSRSAMLRRATR